MKISVAETVSGIVCKQGRSVAHQQQRADVLLNGSATISGAITTQILQRMMMDVMNGRSD